MTNTSDIIISCTPFDSLTPAALYQIIQLRNEVFVVEQQCVFQDADGKDPYAHHLTIQKGDVLIAYEYMSIGRVISAATSRRTGAGKLLMKEAIAECRRLFGEGPIKIGAQLYLKNFYGSFGFAPIGEVYLEDNIEHIHMILQG
jgi:ElaA protein